VNRGAAIMCGAAICGAGTIRGAGAAKCDAGAEKFGAGAAIWGAGAEKCGAGAETRGPAAGTPPPGPRRSCAAAPVMREAETRTRIPSVPAPAPFGRIIETSGTIPGPITVAGHHSTRPTGPGVADEPSSAGASACD
jgi:hypothetical protein